ncbi:hypothetical protein Droror1_Dr00027499 [Drosera rotundifolia]
MELAPFSSSGSSRPNTTAIVVSAADSITSIVDATAARRLFNSVTRSQLIQCWSYLSGVVSFEPLGALDMLTLLNLSVNYLIINSIESLLYLPFGIQQLQLPSAGLQGMIPPHFLDGFPSLAYVDLSENNLTGDIPRMLLFGRNHKLEFLDLSLNRICRPISVMKVSEHSCLLLRMLNLSSSQLTGSIPDSLSNCTNLKTVNLSNNLLSGEILPMFLNITFSSIVSKSSTAVTWSGCLSPTMRLQVQSHRSLGS